MRSRLAVTLVCLLAVTAVWSGRGAAELYLDAAAVKEILGAALGEPRRLEVPGLGELTLELGPVRRVELSGGTVEATVAVRIREIDVADDVRVSFLPEVERTMGRARLVPREAHLAGLPFDLDLSRFLAPAELPRSVAWDLALPGARPLPLVCYVQGIAVEKDRLRIDLGLVGETGPERAGNESPR